jgi:hypothetical protein
MKKSEQNTAQLQLLEDIDLEAVTGGAPIALYPGYKAPVPERNSLSAPKLTSIKCKHCFVNFDSQTALNNHMNTTHALR